jgi:hypothetical protein
VFDERLGHDRETPLRTSAHTIRQDEGRVRTIVDATSAVALRTG